LEETAAIQKRSALPEPETSRPYLILYPSLEETGEFVKRVAEQTSRPYLILYPSLEEEAEIQKRAAEPATPRPYLILYPG
jgi:hypothetical protein